MASRLICSTNFNTVSYLMSSEELGRSCNHSKYWALKRPLTSEELWIRLNSVARSSTSTDLVALVVHNFWLTLTLKQTSLDQVHCLFPVGVSSMVVRNTIKTSCHGLVNNTCDLSEH